MSAPDRSAASVRELVDPEAEANRSGNWHRDEHLNEPRILTDERLVNIVAECLRKWESFPTIPGSLRWSRNGMAALREIERRLHADA